MRSVWSLLTTIPFSDRDVFYKDIMGTRLKYAHKSPIQYHLKTIKRDGVKHEIPWIQTGYGSYAIVERDIPFLHRGLPRTHEGISVLYSDKPRSLKDALSGDHAKASDIDQLSHQKKSDFMILGELSYERVINSIIKDHQKLKDDIQSHETFIGESERLWRSDSCVIFAIPHKDEPEHYDLYQYFNPFGEDGLFIKDDMLDNKKFQSFLKSVSLKTTTHPVAKSHLNQWMQDRANHAAKQIMNGHSPDKTYQISGNGFKKIVKGCTQPLFHTLARLNLTTVIVGTAAAAISAYGFVFVASLFTAAKTIGVSSLFTKTAISSVLLSSNPLSRMTNGAIKAVSRFTHNNKLKDVKRFYDYKVDFTPYPHFITNTIRATKINSNFFNGIKFIPYEDIETAIGIPKSDLSVHDKIAEDQWLISQKCYSDCHKGASVISFVQNRDTGQPAFQLIDGRRVAFIHEKQGEAVVINDDQTTHIEKNNGDTYSEKPFAFGASVKYVPYDYERPEQKPLSDHPIATDRALSIMPDGRAKKRAVKARDAFTSSSLPKSPHPLESVVRDAPVRKL